VTNPTLQQLEARIATLPADATKHDMEAGFEVMAQWIQTLDRSRRAEVLSELPAWLRDADSWHSRAVMAIALKLRDRQLLEAAVREAKTLGVHDLAGGKEYPPWLIYHLYLLFTISHWQGDPGSVVREYMSGLRWGVCDELLAASPGDSDLVHRMLVGSDRAAEAVPYRGFDGVEKMARCSSSAVWPFASSRVLRAHT